MEGGRPSIEGGEATGKLMKILTEIILDRPRQEVWNAFDSVENLYKWQPTLKSFEHLSGEPGQPGATSKFVYEENGNIFENLETITRRNEPEEFAGTYDSRPSTKTKPDGPAYPNFNSRASSKSWFAHEGPHPKTNLSRHRTLQGNAGVRTIA
jgi:hypothetical protein